MSRILAFAAVIGLAACTAAVSDPQTAASLASADLPLGAGEDWDNPGGDWGESHFSRLETINRSNVARMGLAWEYDMGTARVQEATPVVIDGVMYTAGNLGRVYALNAATGEELWTFTPELDMQVNRSACCDQANRGVAVADGKVMVGALDGKLWALDMATGEPVWSVDTIVDHTRGYTSTGAPEVAGDLVVIGNGGAEYDARGYVTAYRIADGSQAWRFFTVPRDPAEGPQENPELEPALATWSEETRWDIGGGGTAWDAIVYDPQFDQVIVGTGNGGPYPQAIRSPGGGDNLYLNSLVALDRETGRMNWYFQETPQDNWDLTATQPMILASMDVEGEERPVILHTPKNGNFYVVDRENGHAHAANPLVRMNWSDGFDTETQKHNITLAESDYSDGPKIVYPGSPGARNWYPAAYDPTRETYFAHVLDMGNLLFLTGPADDVEYKEKALNAGAAIIFTSDLQAAAETLPPPLQAAVMAEAAWKWVLDKPFESQLRAIDPLTGDTKWAVESLGWQDRHGVLSTQNGLVFHGDVGGTLYARDADTGEALWSIETGSTIMAAPMTYMVEGVQYVAVQTGWGGGGWGFVPRYAAAYQKGNANRILVFRLDGGQVAIPADLPPLQPAPEPPPQYADATPEMIAAGAAMFTENCTMCHSNQPRAPLPDLRRMNRGVHAGFQQIVRGGLFVSRGMPHFEDLLTEDEVKAIHAWLISVQGPLRERELQLQAEGLPLDTQSLTILSNY
ncbi:PQQ-dependent dehydrogenase, methanol/ethanol family [Aurantiacibacter poecillastricola]|uniref:PQQ-dependent dehydrogenase, methanol/ethanol family n=1 Tax=Aurantiacibacter poecillastricola TaxID=3064385 RepID=UPI00273F7C03|nr:PQQ-dependent dehydrogenase, methanol/ethanol family [Aurantiacibacter sp. 219JJ12-13]MDP5260065.1 PQQ-dependent dehydrogenase, methanol/ethanol family [Aurantiacibacter sp. 219JJ12-13]